MPRSKEISDELRKKVVEAHETGKGYKSIGKMFDLHSSTVRKIINKWKVFNTTATRPRSGRPTKLDSSLPKVRSGAENENRRIGKDISNSADGGESSQVSGTNAVSESTSVAVNVGLEDHILASMNPGRPNDSAVIRTPKHIRGHIENIKDLKLMRNHVLASPPTHSCSQAPIIPQCDAPTPGPGEHHMEVMLCCDICGTCFPTEPELEVHQAQHLAKMMHECEECGKVFQSAAGLKAHKKRKHSC